MAGLNPWDPGYVAPVQTPVQQQASPALNPWEPGYQTPSPDQGLSNDLNSMREGGQFDGSLGTPAETPLQTQRQLYDPIRNQSKYQPLTDYENSAGNTWGNVQTGVDPHTDHIGGQYSLDLAWPPYKKMPPDLVQMHNQRADEMATKYANTGSAESVPMMGTLDTSHMGWNSNERVQTNTVNNPNFDPSKDPGPDNQPMITTKYLVDPPDREGIMRMGYQVAQNIVGGIGDFANDISKGKLPSLTSEGEVGAKFPETVPSGPGEKFATDMTTFIVGPKVLGVPFKAAGAVAAGTEAGGALAQKAATLMSPEAANYIQKTYADTLKTTGSAAKALQVSTAVTKNALVGLSFGLAEGVVAPNGSQGIVSPEWLSEKMGVSKDRAQDFSMMLDTPMISGSLEAIGSIYNLVANKFVKPTFGGLRNVKILGMNAGNAVPLNDTTAGLKLFTWLDPNMVGLPPELAGQNIKVMSDALQRSSIKNLQLAGVGKAVQMDSPSAFQDIARDYYKTAYAYKKDYMGAKDFNDWVAHQADDSSNRMFQLRTALNSNDTPAKGAYQIDSLFSDAADKVAGGDLTAAQTATGQIGGEAQMAKGKVADDQLAIGQNTHNYQTGVNDYNQGIVNKVTNEANTQDYDAMAVAKTQAQNQKMVEDANLGTQKIGNDQANLQDQNTLQNAKNEAEQATTATKNVISNDPQMNELITKAQSINPFNSKTGDITRIKAMSEPTYEALKTMRGQTDAAYQKIADSGAEGDPNSLLEIIKSGPQDDPFLKRIAEQVNENPSFDNLYTNVKRQVQSELNKVKNPDDPRAQTLFQIRNNIDNDQLDFLKQNGDQDVVKMVDDAKSKYINYITTFKDNSDIKSVAEAGESRLYKEKFPEGMGPGQGVNDYQKTFQDTVSKNLDARDGGIFLDTLSKANKAGGQDIDSHISDALTAKSIDNLAQSLKDGSPESVSTLRGSLRDTITGLEKINPDSPLLAKYKELATNMDTLQLMAGNKTSRAAQIGEDVSQAKTARDMNFNNAQQSADFRKVAIDQNLQNTQNTINQAKDARDTNLSLMQKDTTNRQASIDAQFQRVQDQVSDLRKAANLSVLKNFVYHGEEGDRAISGGTTEGVLKKMFHAPNSEEQLVDLMTQFNKLGDKGDVAKDALKGTYVDYIRDRLGSRQSLGPVSGGTPPPETAYRISEPNAKKIFGEGSKDMNNLQILFHDQPEVIDQLKEAKNTYLSLTRKTPKSDADKALTTVSRAEDPQQALNSLITFTLGVLNPKASRVRRLTGPLSVESLEQVRSRKGDLLDEAIGSADAMSKLGAKTSEKVINSGAGSERRASQSRAAVRGFSNYFNSGSDRKTKDDNLK